MNLAADGISVVKARSAVLKLLADHQWHTTVEINRVGGTEGTRRLRELRAAPYYLHIERTRVIGARVWQYRWVPKDGR